MKGLNKLYFKNFITFQRGFDLPKNQMTCGPYPVVGSTSIIGFHNQYKILPPGVVTGRSGSLGEVQYIKEKYWPHNTSLWVKNFKNNYPKYVYYFLRSIDLKRFNSGVGVPTLNRNDLDMLEVSVHGYTEQEKIASILSAYDDLIENNTRRIKILEEMAKTIYDEWFVKFRFPGHEKVKMVKSELGMIPEGWEVSEFRNLFEIKYGKTLPKTEISERGPYPVYGAGDVIGYYDRLLCPKKCALVTSRGNGSGTVWRTREAAFVTNNSLIILPQEKFGHWDYSYVELLLKHSNVMGAKTGSAQPQVTIENLNYVKAIVPPRKIVEKFCAFATPIYEQVDLLFEKNTILRRTRDLLLPKLISGELDVSELDITIPEAHT